MNTLNQPTFSIPRQRLDLRNNPASNLLEIQKELDRVAGFMRRLHAWECSSCREIFPQETPNFFGACRQCWEENEDLDKRIGFESVADDEIARNFLKWNYPGMIYKSLISQIHQQRDLRYAPPEFDWLDVLFTWFDAERVWKAVATRTRKNTPDPTRFRWYYGRGFANYETDLTGLPGDVSEPLSRELRDRIERGYRDALRKP